MKLKFPILSITETERLWLVEEYQFFKQNKKSVPQLIWVKLHNKIPLDFNQYNIDKRLYNGNQLTLLGIWHVNPKDEIFRMGLSHS